MAIIIHIQSELPPKIPLLQLLLHITLPPLIHTIPKGCLMLIKYTGHI